LYARGADERREPASVTKIMTQLLIVEAVEAGTLTLDEIVTASASAAGIGGSQMYLEEGERISVRDLMKALTVNSANDAAVVMAERIAGSEEAFAKLMNERAGALGMADTHFTNASGLYPDDEHYTTARDVAIMSRELMGHELIREFTTIWTGTLRDGTFNLANTNRLIHDYKGATGLKTGYTSRAGYCLSAAAERDGIEYIAVVLGCDTGAIRFGEAAALLDFAFNNYVLISLLPSEPLPPVPVVLGKARYVQPVPEGDVCLVVTKAEARVIEKRISILTAVPAPVLEGERLGAIVVHSGDRIIAELDIVSAESSRSLTWAEIFARFFSLLFTAG
ncbi:MAG: D-alanyl-D-alanine carboxypeptidase, partial [Oscillospiraceae bacterium]|nr:D-alanyl-D-alanine carboxypeptidase [Oscillospiraceae bacterium]